MVAIQEVRSQLAGLKSCGPGIVGVFVGSTSGIGENTAREFVRYSSSPHVYLVGRNATQGALLKTEFQQLNSESNVQFIQSDISLLRNVDDVCAEIKFKEDKINLLVLSQGTATTKYNESSEGLDKKLSLHYYSRLRFAQNLLPLLNKAAGSGSKSPARVLSVLGAGLETSMNMDDLALKSSYSIRAAANHAITMNTLAFQQLALNNKGVTFIHSQPGGVSGTNLARDLPRWMTSLLIGASSTVLKPWVMTAKECGERLTWTGTVAKWSAGEVILVGRTGDKTGNPKTLAKMSEDGIQDKVWKHTSEIFENVCDKTKSIDTAV